MSLLVKNCRLLENNQSIKRNILIENNKISIISSKTLKAEETINAQNNFVIPGLIDSHVHFREPGMTAKEGWYSGSRAALFGGVTTVLDMPNTNPPTITQKELDYKRSLAFKSLVNYGFHFGASKSNLKEICKIQNVASIKVFMGSSTGDLLVDEPSLLEKIFSGANQIVSVHAEDETLIKKNTMKYKNSKNPSHLAIRPNNCAKVALKRAIEISLKCGNSLYACHVSTGDELQLIANNKQKMILHAEVTPHHLFLTNKDFMKSGNFAKMNPPLRTEKDRALLWNGIKSGLVSTIATDHAPHLIEEKKKPYWEAPAGVPGVETMLPLLLNEVNKGNLSLKKLVELTSRNPAKIFNIAKKGEIKVGYDADLVIIDLKKQRVVKNEELQTKCKWSPFSGKKLKGIPITTIVNGNITFHDNIIYDTFAKEIKYGGVK